jgi:hypothetical protein
MRVMKINRTPHESKADYYNRDYSFNFSDDIEKWIKGKRITGQVKRKYTKRKRK